MGLGPRRTYKQSKDASRHTSLLSDKKAPLGLPCKANCNAKQSLRTHGDTWVGLQDNFSLLSNIMK